MGCCDKGKKAPWIFCSIGITLIVAVILLSLSVSLVEVDEIALTKTVRTQQLSYDEGYAGSGRHFVGLFKDLIVFKKNKIQIDFAEDSTTANSTVVTTEVTRGGNKLSCWTKDGTNVYIELSYFIQIIPEKLLPLYQEFGDKWIDFIVRFSYSSVKETTILYSTEEFFTERNAIASSITSSLVEGIAKYFFGAVTVSDLQLRKIHFDQKFEDSTVQKLIQSQRKKSNINNKEVRRVVKETEQEVAVIQNRIDKVLSKARAEGKKQTEITTSTSFKDVILSFNTAYSNLKTTLSVADNLELKKYMYAMELELVKNFDEIVMVDAKSQKFLQV